MQKEALYAETIPINVGIKPALNELCQLVHNTGTYTFFQRPVVETVLYAFRNLNMMIIKIMWSLFAKSLAARTGKWKHKNSNLHKKYR